MGWRNASMGANTSISLAAVQSSDARRVQLKVGRYDGQMSWEAFQANFKLVAAANGWSVMEKAVQLVMLLEGEAQRVLLDLTIDEMKDPHALATAVGRCFDKTVPAVAIRQKFSKCAQKPGEALGVFAAEVRYLARKGFIQFPEDVCLALATEAFIAGLTPEALQQHVHLPRPETLEEALEKALAVELVFIEGHPTISRLQHSGPPRLPPVDAQNLICWCCGQRGHMCRHCSTGPHLKVIPCLWSTMSTKDTSPYLTAAAYWYKYEGYVLPPEPTPFPMNPTHVHTPQHPETPPVTPSPSESGVRDRALKTGWQEPVTGDVWWQLVVPEVLQEGVLGLHHGPPGVDNFGVMAF
ncbi:hypothetical protein SKAU_G00279770 [Synaphobranchus kaupii]|uniref:CCHC-type domain-containing protein n=1 Tax=Synaphobranchus kaupii TaxID=118154 RepID=A0A9Q1EWV8_SYNKA|nr:hypothetical protein SKAU_G00279770 [Synaphobranchus kaupii]